MVKKGKVPDAWDDDWEVQADRAADEEKRAAPEPLMPTTRAERNARHEEEQKKLWETADATPEEANFMAAQSTVPLTTTFKPAVKVLSRKPAPQLIAKKDPVTGLQQLKLQDDIDAAEEEEEARRNQPSVEEIRRRQQRELEERQRRYDEARAKIFGDSNHSSGTSSPGTVTPPYGNEGRQNYRGRGRGRGGGGYRGDRGDHRGNNRQETQNSRPGSSQQAQNSRPGSSQQQGKRELFDPNYSPKPGSNSQSNASRRGGDSTPTRPREEDQIIRAPRGPDSSGRGGFGFARRGTREG